RGHELIIRAFANEIKTDQPHNWIAIRLQESPGPGYSPNGAKVAITDVSGRVQTRWIVSGDSFLAQHAPVAHFGLGEATGIGSVEITWPNGKAESHDVHSAVNTTLTFKGAQAVKE
ncbi:MAG: ASPIC/UnbV domain-containing protein, partial [Akkermansiaceae bacterium]